MVTPKVDSFFHETCNNVCYVVADPATARCAVIDSVLDYDAKSGRTATAFADEVIAFLRAEGLGVDWILETHVHADHVTAAPYLKEKLGGRIGIGSGVTEVQKTFGALFNAGAEFATDGSQFDHLFADGERFAIGGLEAEVLHTPGHTPACVCYRFGDAVFVGDTIFMPDAGTARCDFPGGCAKTLYRSLNRILALPDDTRLYINHDYGAGGQRAIAWQTTVAQERAANIHCKEGTSEADYVSMREARDATLAMPNLLLPAVQINMRGGHFPPPEDNGTSYLKFPLNAV
jgi:glyoxylase-like metal-dependent hydrolase (beta-lactamase superfamily II)